MLFGRPAPSSLVTRRKSAAIVFHEQWWIFLNQTLLCRKTVQFPAADVRLGVQHKHGSTRVKAKYRGQKAISRCCSLALATLLIDLHYSSLHTVGPGPGDSGFTRDTKLAL